MTAVVLAFAPAAERRRQRTQTAALAGRPLYYTEKGKRAHGIRWSYPEMTRDDGTVVGPSVVLRCGALMPFRSLRRAGTDAPICDRCARSTVE